jgi:NAD(P)H-nitrite reductase large subunit
MRTRHDPGARVYSFFDQRKEVYKKLVVDAEGKKLIGAVLVGDTSDYSMWHQTVANAMAAARKPRDHVVSGSGGECGCTPDQRAGCAAGNSVDLFLQQRDEGRSLLRPSRRAAPRSAR